jgi:predicted PurR-regulated permease PerM
VCPRRNDEQLDLYFEHSFGTIRVGPGSSERQGEARFGICGPKTWPTGRELATARAPKGRKGRRPIDRSAALTHAYRREKRKGSMTTAEIEPKAEPLVAPENKSFEGSRAAGALTDGHPLSEQEAMRRVVETAIRLGVIGLVLYLCFRAFEPFLGFTLWGTMIAVALRPLHRRVTVAFAGRSTWAAVALAAGLVALLAIPGVIVMNSLSSAVHEVIASFRAGTLQVPPPPSSVQEWPLVGKKAHEAWLLASQDLRAALLQSGIELDKVSAWLIGVVRNTGAAVVQFILATVTAAIMLAGTERCTRVLRVLSTKLSPNQGIAHLVLAERTVRSVAVGVIGVAVLQTALAAVGFLLADVPGAGLLILVALVLSVVQIGVGIPMIGAAVYLFSHASTTTAVAFTVWTVLVVPLDNILRPLLLGRGASVPMLVVFIGAIGGFLQVGLIGMFLGSVIFALGYQLVRAWLGLTGAEATPQAKAAMESPSLIEGP